MKRQATTTTIELVADAPARRRLPNGRFAPREAPAAPEPAGVLHDILLAAEHPTLYAVLDAPAGPTLGELEEAYRVDEQLDRFALRCCMRRVTTACWTQQRIVETGGHFRY